VKFTGSGGGGSVLAFVPKQERDNAISSLRKMRKAQKCRSFSEGLTEQTPGVIKGHKLRGNAKKRRIYIYLILIIGIIVLSFLNVLTANLQQVNSKGWISVLPVAIAISVVLLPALYRVYLVACKAPSIHTASRFQRALQYKWWIRRGVGSILEQCREEATGKLLIWLFLLLWSNLVLISLLVCNFILGGLSLR